MATYPIQYPGAQSQEGIRLHNPFPNALPDVLVSHNFVPSAVLGCKDAGHATITVAGSPPPGCGMAT